MVRLVLALMLLTVPAMAQVGAGTAPIVGGSGNSPAPDVSSPSASEAPSRRATVKRAPRHRPARPMHSGATAR